MSTPKHLLLPLHGWMAPFVTKPWLPPDRFETIVGERGANLSGGQRQRLAIARALLRQPDTLIFDEATSHLDTATERAIQENLRKELAGKTVVLVAHRLSTIRSADLIYVMHLGQVVNRCRPTGDFDDAPAQLPSPEADPLATGGSLGSVASGVVAADHGSITRRVLLSVVHRRA